MVFSIAPSPVKADEIWAGSDTGLLHLTRDGGKTWQNVTPNGVGDWSKIAMIEASRFDPAVAYVAVDRHRLDDDRPYLYRTRDYGRTWQPIATGIGEQSFVNAIREDTKQKGLLFAGTELGIYVSFDNGDRWQPLQLNLPVASIRDIAIHGDDLIVATHGRAFWILDDITPLREIASRPPSAGNARLYQPATAVRVDNDVFLGSPLPPEEPAAKNPPDGAVHRLLPACAGQAGETGNLRSQRETGAPICERRKTANLSSAAHCAALVASARGAGEHRRHAPLCLGPAVGQLRKPRRDRGRRRLRSAKGAQDYSWYLSN